jgi:excisionase family DNA binding protein
MPTPVLDEPTYKPLQELSPDELLTEEVAAHYLSITPRQMVDLIQKNRIPHHRIGWRTVRIKVVDLREFLERTRIPAKSIPVRSRITKKLAKQQGKEDGA